MPLPIPQNDNVRQRPRQSMVRPRPTAPLPLPPRPRPAASYRPPRYQAAHGRPRSHRVAATLIGVVLYAIIDYWSDSLFTQNNPFLSHTLYSLQVGDILYNLNLGNCLTALLFLVPLFFGAVYGPWVGLIVGGAGLWLGDSIASHVFGFPFFWSWCVGMGLVGLVASMAPFRTRTSYGCLGTLFICAIVGGIALVSGLAFAAWSNNPQLSGEDIRNYLVGTAPGIVLALLLFFILMLIYSAVVRSYRN